MNNPRKDAANQQNIYDDCIQYYFNLMRNEPNQDADEIKNLRMKLKDFRNNPTQENCKAVCDLLDVNFNNDRNLRIAVRAKYLREKIRLKDNDKFQIIENNFDNYFIKYMENALGDPEPGLDLLVRDPDEKYEAVENMEGVLGDPGLGLNLLEELSPDEKYEAVEKLRFDSALAKLKLKTTLEMVDGIDPLFSNLKASAKALHDALAPIKDNVDINDWPILITLIDHATACVNEPNLANLEKYHRSYTLFKETKTGKKEKILSDAMASLGIACESIIRPKKDDFSTIPKEPLRRKLITSAWKMVFSEFYDLYQPEKLQSKAKNSVRILRWLTFPTLLLKLPVKFLLEFPFKLIEYFCLWDQDQPSSGILRRSAGHFFGILSSLIRYTISFNPVQSASEASHPEARPTKWLGEAAGKFAGFMAAMFSLGGIAATAFGGPTLIAGITGGLTAGVISTQTIIGTATAFPLAWIGVVTCLSLLCNTVSTFAKKAFSGQSSSDFFETTCESKIPPNVKFTAKTKYSTWPQLLLSVGPMKSIIQQDSKLTSIKEESEKTVSEASEGLGNSQREGVENSQREGVENESRTKAKISRSS